MGRGRQAGPETPLASVKKLAEAVQNAGHPWEELLCPFGLTLDGLETFEGRISFDLYLQIFALAEEICGDPSLGRTLGKRASLSSFDLYGQVILYASDLREALDRTARFYRLWSSAGAWEVRDEERMTFISYHVPGFDPDGARPDVEFTLAAVLALLRGASATPIRVVELAWSHLSPDPLGDEEFFGAAPGFSPMGALLALARDDLAAPLSARPSPLRTAVETYAERALSQIEPANGWTARTVDALQNCERTGRWDVGSLARELHVSPRTLQRGLQGEGTSFQAELDRFRHRRTKELLITTPASLAEIAFALGFSEVSALVRAFKRWEGAAPGDFRRKALSP